MLYQSLLLYIPLYRKYFTYMYQTQWNGKVGAKLTIISETTPSKFVEDKYPIAIKNDKKPLGMFLNFY